MPEMRRGIAGMITAACLVGIGSLIYMAPNHGAVLLGAIIGFVFTLSVLAALFRNSFIGGVVTVGALIGFGVLLWQCPGPEFILGSGVLGGICAVITLFLALPPRKI